MINDTTHETQLKDPNLIKKIIQCSITVLLLLGVYFIIKQNNEFLSAVGSTLWNGLTIVLSGISSFISSSIVYLISKVKPLSPYLMFMCLGISAICNCLLFKIDIQYTKTRGKIWKIILSSMMFVYIFGIMYASFLIEPVSVSMWDSQLPTEAEKLVNDSNFWPMMIAGMVLVIATVLNLIRGGVDEKANQ